MNTPITSKEAILGTCRQLVSEKGLSALNIRTVSAACGIALGSVYYYFPSKKDLMVATIESVWEDIFCMKDLGQVKMHFPDFVLHVYEHIQKGILRYPNFFTIHSLSFSSDEKSMARDSMDRYFVHIKEMLLRALHADEGISKEAFTEDFSENDLVGIVLMNYISLLILKQSDCKVLVEMIRRVVYGKL